MKMLFGVNRNNKIYFVLSNKKQSGEKMRNKREILNFIKENDLSPKKYYAVKIGKIEGIFLDWDSCKDSVNGVPNATYKSFPTIDEALNFVGFQEQESVKKAQTKPQKTTDDTAKELPDFNKEEVIAYVDGSYNVNNKKYGYGVLLKCGTEEISFYGSGEDEEMASMRNVAGEILGTTEAIRKAIKLGYKTINIFYDYQGIEAWANGKWKRNKKGTIAYHNFIQASRKKIRINFFKVKAHSGVEDNEIVDQLAKKAVGIKTYGDEVEE